MASEYKENPEFIKSVRDKTIKAIDRASVAFQADLKQTLSKSESPSRPGEPPGAETGSLRRSVQIDRTGLNDKLLNRVGTGLFYGRVLEFGARIHPKKAKNLAIPLTSKAKRHSSPREFPGELQLIPRKNRPPLLVESVGKRRRRMIVHYVLVPKSRIAARPWLRPTLNVFKRDRFFGFFKGITA